MKRSRNNSERKQGLYSVVLLCCKTWLQVMVAVCLMLSVVHAAPVTTERLVNANAEVDNWLTHGRSYDESRFSPLKQINDSNVTELGLAWSYEFPDSRGLQSTPIVADGVMYSTGSWSRVYAHNAATGELLWAYDPKVPREYLVRACCGPMNRGVAVWENKVYVGSLDGYLIAVDRESGAEVWRTLTVDQSKDYTITGAPRVVKGRVLIGNGGAEYGVRGYLSAYDGETGELAWRFYTVPGNPADGFENEALEMAAKTWNGEWWKQGGGGTVWDSFSYDPQLNLVYIGVGNGSPWNHKIRSPGGGDNLFLSSIVAVNADTGEYVWHYQTTPGESWDFTAAQQIILADIEWNGEARKVLMQAPKNGFFFVIDRVTGEYLSAVPFTKVLWASGYDENGRPMEAEGIRFEKNKMLMMPSAVGGHNWHSMAYSPDTGLVYIPVIKAMMEYQQPENFDPKPHHQNFGVDLPAETLVDAYFMQMLKSKVTRGVLQAWDPVRQKPAWSYKHARTWNGGVLATAGNLVFQGTADHKFMAFDAKTGDVLWQYDSRLAIMAAPVTYRVDGEQYIAVLAKWGGGFPLAVGLPPIHGLEKGRLLVFKLNGDAQLPALPPKKTPMNKPLSMTMTDEGALKEGEALYEAYCGACHGKDGVSGGTVPDLRFRASQYPFEAFRIFVLDGVLAEKGMVSFSDVLDEEKAEKVYNYLLQKANLEYELQQQKSSFAMRLRLWIYDKLVSLIVLAVDGSVVFYLGAALFNLLVLWLLFRIYRRFRTK